MIVNVLLSTYNGEKYLKELLDSVINQKEVRVKILVRDDGSTDNTIKILETYQKQRLLEWYSGKNIGAAKSFWDLLKKASEADYYALCDQDDVWDKDKLQIAIDELSIKNNKKPNLYFSDVRVVDENLNVISENMIEKSIVDFPHSLVRNLAPGCTFVFNNSAKKEIEKMLVDDIENAMHDWCIYRIVAAIGDVVLDKNSHISYRQHGNNVIGANRGFIKNIINAASRFFNKSEIANRSKFAKKILFYYQPIMKPENIRIAINLAHYSDDISNKIAILKSRKYDTDFFRTLYFKILILLNRV